VVELSAALAAGLAGLNLALDDPDVDIAESLQLLDTAVASAVSSFLGLSLTIDGVGQRSVLTAIRPDIADHDIATSLRVPLSRGEESGDITLVLYSATPGAFVDLAADMSWLLGDGAEPFVLDDDLSAPVESVDGLLELSVVNQAIGVLIAGGYTGADASGILDVLAADGAGHRPTAAARLLVELDDERRRP
jgi:hypothetical protein